MIPPDRSDNPAAAELFAQLLHSATTGHMLHLQSLSYSEHKALQKFYEQMPDLADTLIEAYQGKYGRVMDYPSGYEPYTGPAIDFVSTLSDYFMMARASIGSDSELQNLCDEIQQLFDSTLYKLRFLQ